jgi:hypothetical protein
MSAVLAVLSLGVLLLAWLLWQEERELRRTFEMLGTTGFHDVDARFRQYGVVKQLPWFSLQQHRSPQRVFAEPSRGAEGGDQSAGDREVADQAADADPQDVDFEAADN